MNRVTVASSAAMSIGTLLAALLSMSSLAAEPGRSAGNEAVLQQRLEAAQRRLERATDEIADLSSALSEGRQSGTTRNSRRFQRAVLGINIGTDEADGRRSDGVKVFSVTPGSGAYEAGLKSGDLLLSVNDQRLRRQGDESPRDKLLALMRGVRPGDQLAVKYEREGFIKTVNLTARAIPDRSVEDQPSVGRAPRLVPAPPAPPAAPVPVEAPKVAIQRVEGVLGNAELVPLTPRLGQYFGTDKGLLVVRAPADEALDIQEGDVILEIDGRTPDSTSHAMRILNSYQPGEELSVSVYRRKRRFDIDVVIPDDAPRARLEQRQDRPRNVVTAPAPRANAAKPRRPAPAQAPAASEGLQVQPLPDDEVEVEPVN
jgi:S1-C subfamily serine protease